MPNNARDPVCGAPVDVQLGKGRKESFENSDYYFCSDTCRDRFKQSPKDYVPPTA